MYNDCIMFATEPRCKSMPHLHALCFMMYNVISYDSWILNDPYARASIINAPIYIRAASIHIAIVSYVFLSVIYNIVMLVLYTDIVLLTVQCTASFYNSFSFITFFLQRTTEAIMCNHRGWQSIPCPAQDNDRYRGLVPPSLWLTTSKILSHSGLYL